MGFFSIFFFLQMLSIHSIMVCFHSGTISLVYFLIWPKTVYFRTEILKKTSVALVVLDVKWYFCCHLHQCCCRYCLLGICVNLKVLQSYTETWLQDQLLTRDCKCWHTIDRFRLRHYIQKYKGCTIKEETSTQISGLSTQQYCIQYVEKISHRLCGFSFQLLSTFRVMRLTIKLD